MPKEPPPELRSLIGELALAAVEVQRVLDRERVAALERLPPESADLVEKLGLADLFAPNLQVTEFRVDASVAISTARSREFSISARPINLEYRQLSGSTEATESRLSIWICRAPLPDSIQTSSTSK